MTIINEFDFTEPLDSRPQKIITVEVTPGVFADVKCISDSCMYVMAGENGDTLYDREWNGLGMAKNEAEIVEFVRKSVKTIG